MAVDAKTYLSKNVIFVKYFGCWSPKNEAQAKIYKIYSIFMYIALVMTMPVASIVYFLTKEKLDVVEVADNAYMVSELTAYMFRMAFWLQREKLIKHTFNSLRDPIFNKEGEDVYVKRAAFKALWIYRVFVSCCIVALLAWAAVPLFAKERILPLEIWYPFDPLKYTVGYVFVYGHIFLAVAGCTVINASTGTAVSGLMIHATGQLKILKSTLRHISDYANYIEETISDTRQNPLEIMDYMLYPRIIACIKHHEKIVEYVQNIETCFGLYTFAQFTAGSFIICLTAVELTIISPMSFQFYWMLMYMMCMLTELLLFCWFGTELFYESINISDAIYLTDWYKYGPKSKKALLILMERSKRPLRVRAAKLFDLSLETYMRILKGAYSIFAVIQHLLHSGSK